MKAKIYFELFFFPSIYNLSSYVHRVLSLVLLRLRLFYSLDDFCDESPVRKKSKKKASKKSKKKSYQTSSSSSSSSSSESSYRKSSKKGLIHFKTINILFSQYKIFN